MMSSCGTARKTEGSLLTRSRLNMIGKGRRLCSKSLAVGKEIAELRNPAAGPPSALTETQLDKLRMLYLDRLNVLQGNSPARRSVLSKTADAVFEIVDGARHRASLMGKTVSKTVQPGRVPR